MAKTKLKNKEHDDCWNSIGVWGSAENRCDRLSEVIHCRNCDVFSQAGRTVFERQPPVGYVTQWRNEIANQQKENNNETTGIILFRLLDEWFAFPAALLQEIAEQRELHRVPHNDNPHIAGVVNIGGEINVCYSLASLMGVGRLVKEENVYQRLMVVKVDGERYIFPVSEISGLTHYGKEEILPPPATLGSEKSSFVNGIYTFQNNQVAVLDIEQVCRALGGAIT